MDSVDQIRSEEVRNWLELPQDVLSLIFMKLGPVEVLVRAQSVCSSWRKVSKEPQLWRLIYFRDPWDFAESEVDFEKVARHAVDRSCGQLIEFSVGHFGTDEVLKYITDRSYPLRCLGLAHCIFVTENGMIEAVKKLPLLEELDLSYCHFSKKVLEALGQFCPRLKSLKLKRHSRFGCLYKDYDEEALVIAENMPELRYLNLYGNKLTDDGLRAILDGCPHLETLDLRRCFSVDLEGDLQSRCADRIKSLKLPDDPCEENEFDEFDANTDFDGSYDDDLSGLSEIDLMSDDGYDGYYGFSDGSDLSDYGGYLSDFAF
ncbi:F-box protein SKIP19-like [Telopea speciosissima]|uniref:F-box protein SKIP19-like n=1 Tax=Telopea speciosissima TaxID=54955 RepID=UPI001CC55109|nr:F-box protein SKIP19-like [Telopea speciosissima]